MGDVMASAGVLESVLLERLSGLNGDCLAGRLGLSGLVAALRAPVGEVVEAVGADGVAGLSVADRERVLMVLGFVTGSVERQARAEGLAAGAGVGCFSGYEAALLRLAGSELPVRDTARTFWLVNRSVHGERLLSYTGDRGERFFNWAVCEVDGALGEANGLLREVTAVERISPEGAELLAGLSGLVNRYKAAYAAFRRKDDQGLPITPEFFTTVFRQFLLTVPLGGQTWNGPNAAWLANVFSFDSLFGTAVAWYRRYNLDKVGYLTADEAETVRSDLGGLSVLDVLAASVGLPAGLGSVTGAELASRLVDSRPEVLSAARSVRDAWLVLTQGTKGHQLLVRDWLDKPSAALSEEEIAGLAVKPHLGTGGGTRDLLNDISLMRVQCTNAVVLRDAFRLLDAEGVLKQLDR